MEYLDMVVGNVVMCLVFLIMMWFGSSLDVCGIAKQFKSLILKGLIILTPIFFIFTVLGLKSCLDICWIIMCVCLVIVMVLRIIDAVIGLVFLSWIEDN